MVNGINAFGETMCRANIVNADFIDGHVALIEFLREEEQIRIYAAGNASDKRVKLCRKMLVIPTPLSSRDLCR